MGTNWVTGSYTNGQQRLSRYEKIPSIDASLRPASNVGEAPPAGSALKCSARSPTPGTDWLVVGDFDLLLLGLVVLKPHIRAVGEGELLIHTVAQRFELFTQIAKLLGNAINTPHQRIDLEE